MHANIELAILSASACLDDAYAPPCLTESGDYQSKERQAIGTSFLSWPQFPNLDQFLRKDKYYKQPHNYKEETITEYREFQLSFSDAAN